VVAQFSGELPPAIHRIALPGGAGFFMQTGEKPGGSKRLGGRRSQRHPPFWTHPAV